MIRLEDENIVLRSVDFSDIDTLLLWENSNNDPLYGVFEEQYNRQDIERFVQRQLQYPIEQTEQLRLMICSHGGERLGCVDLTEYDGCKAFISILIYDSYNRRKGFAKSALKLLIKYAVNLGLHTLHAIVLPENGPSTRLFKSLGFINNGGIFYHLSLQ